MLSRRTLLTAALASCALPAFAAPGAETPPATTGPQGAEPPFPGQAHATGGLTGLGIANLVAVMAGFVPALDVKEVRLLPYEYAHFVTEGNLPTALVQLQPDVPVAQHAAEYRSMLRHMVATGSVTADGMMFTSEDMTLEHLAERTRWNIAEMQGRRDYYDKASPRHAV